MTIALIGVGVLLAVAVIGVITHIAVNSANVTPWTGRDQKKQGQRKKDK